MSGTSIIAKFSMSLSRRHFSEAFFLGALRVNLGRGSPKDHLHQIIFKSAQ